MISAIYVATVLAEPPQPLEFRTISLNGDKGGMPAVDTKGKISLVSELGDGVCHPQSKRNRTLPAFTEK